MDALTRLCRPISTSNLVRPERAALMHYARAAWSGEPVVAELERRLAVFHDARHCVALCNGFWGLVMAIRLLARVGRTDVLMPSLTYRRLADVVAWTGLRPRFCEVDPATLACSGATMRDALTEEVGLLLAVHPIVGCCDVAGLEALARASHLPLLFDAVESTFEAIEGGKIGRFGNAECFSLHASKLLNGLEGGYVTSNDDRFADGLRQMRDGLGPDGLDLRLEPLHAAFALAGLDDLDAQVARNRARYERYRDGLRGFSGLRLLSFGDVHPTSYKTIVVELTEAWPVSRDATVARLNEANVLARAYYSPPLHAKPMAFASVAASLPETDRLGSRYMLLPCGDQVSVDDVDAVVGFLHAMAQ